MENIYAIENGSAVHGTYCGVLYSGIVREQRQHTMNHKIMVFSVDLDFPITVFGMERDSLLVNAAADLADLRRYLRHEPDATPIKRVV